MRIRIGINAFGKEIAKIPLKTLNINAEAFSIIMYK